MALELRTPTDNDWAEICRVDGRAFGTTYTAEMIAEARPIHDLSRFRTVVEGGKIVAVAGSYAFDVTLPGGTCAPMGGVTWVATEVTHRGQGLMRKAVEAVHQDIDDRGEPVASLYASQGGIYGHMDYGVATLRPTITLDRRLAVMRQECRSETGSVRHLDGDEIAPTLAEIWERYRRIRVGEVSRSASDFEHQVKREADCEGATSAACYLAHVDGYAVYTITQDWNYGHPQHRLGLKALAAITPEAHAALWSTLLGMDLVGIIESASVAIDDALPYQLVDAREWRTNGIVDGVWVNVRDIAISFGARTYRAPDRLVVEVGAKRWAIEGDLDGGSCKSVRTKADLVTDHAGISSLLYGGQLPSALVAGRRMTARNADVLRRADLFFPTSVAPHCQTGY